VHQDRTQSGLGPREHVFRAAAATDAVAVVDQLGHRPVLVGASLGGVSAILAEGVSDRDVSSGLVLVDITHRTNPRGVERIREFMRSGLEGFGSLEDAAAAIAAYAPHRPKRVNPHDIRPSLRSS